MPSNGLGITCGRSRQVDACVRWARCPEQQTGALRCNLDGCEEINLPIRTTGNNGTGLRSRNRQTVLSQTLDVQLNGTLDSPQSCV